METQGANVMFNFLSHTAPAAPQEDWLTGSRTMCAGAFRSTLWFVIFNEQNNHRIFINLKKEGGNRMRTINLWQDAYFVA